jgi:glycosyltransferase involved in cell wall biosynthesis
MLVYAHRRTGMLRHLEGVLWTALVLGRERPDVIFVQNSFLLLFACAIYRRLRRESRTRIVVDCHNKSLKRDLAGPLGYVFRVIKRWSFARVDMVVISNSLLMPFAKRLCPRVAVLRDPLPETVLSGSSIKDGPLPLPGLQHPFALFVCSFEPDEPAALIFKTAAALAGRGITAVITGDSHLDASAEVVRGIPPVLLPGYLPAESYNALVQCADVIVVLTDDLDCLVCGAYEAIAAERPLVLSDTPLLRSVFGQCAAYAPHESAPLQRIIAARIGVLDPDFEHGKNLFQASFRAEWLTFRHALDEMLCDAVPSADRTSSMCVSPKAVPDQR